MAKTKRIALTQGKSATIDAADAGKVKGKHWYAARIGKTMYAARKVPKPGGGQGTEYLHRVVQPAPGKLVHHKDSSGLVDTRANLQATGQSGNQKGVRHNGKGKGKGKG